MKKISTRIIVLFGILVFFICFGLGVIAYITSYNSLVGVLKETMPKVAMEASVTIEDGIQNQLNKLKIIASLDYMDILNDPDGDISVLESILSDEVKRSKHKQMILINKRGKALFDDGTVSEMKDNPFFQSALSGNTVVSEPMLDGDGTGIIMVYAVPVMLKNELAGVLMAVRDGLELSEFAARVKFGETGEAYIINKQGRTIAHADTNLLLEILKTAHSNDNNSSGSGTADGVSSTTADGISSASINNEENTDDATPRVVDGSIAQKLGFEGFNDVQQHMMEGGTGFGEYQYNGVSKVTGYAPVESHGWSVAVAVDKDEMLSGLSQLKRNFLIISFIFLAAGFLVAYLIGKSTSRPITRLSKECNIMSGGDFSRVIEEKYTKRRDEIGELARSFNSININVSKIIRNVISEAGSVCKAIENVNDNMAALTSEINNMSDIITKLSSKMEENSAMAEEMNATSNEIEGAVDSIAHEAQDKAETAGEVSRRAEKLRTTAIDSQKIAREIHLDVAVKLREGIEKSQAVERIKMLSDIILDISSQTNLLALNAAIEASHAGDAGSGFAVVAREIRDLADYSKKTVNEIQEVTTMVVESVQMLSQSAEQVLEFLEDKVVKDYDMLVVTGEQYNNDAQLLNDIVTSLSAITEQLYASMESMVRAINDVAVASEEGAVETSDLANEAESVAKRTSEVLEQTNAVNKSANKLLEVVSIFKV